MAKKSRQSEPQPPQPEKRPEPLEKASGLYETGKRIYQGVYVRWGRLPAVVVVVLVIMMILWWKWPDIKERPGVEPVMGWLEQLTPVEGPRQDQVLLPHVDPGKFTVFVADLDHDEGNNARDVIVSILEDTAGIRVDRLETVIPAGKTSEVEAGHERARKYLNDSGAGLLIWGARLSVDGRETVHLYITPRQTADLADPARPYELTPDLIIDPSFWGDLVQAVRLAVVAYVSADHSPKDCSNTSQQLSNLIDNVRQHVDGDRARNWSPSTRISIRLSLAEALRILGAITGRPEPFSDAVQLCRMAVAEAEPHSEAWARAQVELGVSVLSAASLKTPAEQISALSEALRSFHAALEVFRTGI
jgi:hypothetical protein